jgi:hypothetical protein
MDMGSANRTVGESATAGVRVRPPLLFVASLVLGLALDRAPIWQPFSFGEPAVMWCTRTPLAVAAAHGRRPHRLILQPWRPS